MVALLILAVAVVGGVTYLILAVAWHALRELLARTLGSQGRSGTHNTGSSSKESAALSAQMAALRVKWAAEDAERAARDARNALLRMRLKRVGIYLTEDDMAALVKANLLESEVEYYEKRANSGSAPQTHQPADLTGSRRSEPHPLSPDPDATKDYPEPFREGGKYGSHPSHDDYSDEGLP